MQWRISGQMVNQIQVVGSADLLFFRTTFPLKFLLCFNVQSLYIFYFLLKLILALRINTDFPNLYSSRYKLDITVGIDVK